MDLVSSEELGVTDTTDPSHHCAICGSSDELKACANCTQVYYCCKQHQVDDWKVHKTLCKSVSSSSDAKLVKKMAELSVQLKNEMESQSSKTANDEPSHPTNHVEDNVPSEPAIPSGLPTNITMQWLNKISYDVVNCLNQFGVAVVNSFIGPAMGNMILSEVHQLHERNMMTDGQTITQSADSQASKEQETRRRYRTDKIAWVHGTESYCKHIGKLVSLLDIFIRLCGEKLPQYKIQGRTQAMIACYPGSGSHYMKHVDNPNKDGRLLTCIYYLNKDWKTREDGGLLKIYPEGTARVASVEPLMDRLLLFWSDKRNPHEVLPAYRTRYAVTLWYFDAVEREKAVKASHKRSAPSESTGST